MTPVGILMLLLLFFSAGVIVGRVTRCLAPVLVGLFCTAAMAQTPLLDVRSALADAQTLPNPQHVRYLSLSSIAAEKRLECFIAINHAVNDLSRTRGIYPVASVTPTLVRIDVSQYCNDAAELESWEGAWSSLSQSDPYFHLATQVSYAGKIQTVVVAGGWTDPKTEAALRQVTNTPSNGCILRADWFVARALVAPNYYQFLGAADNQTGWYKSLGVDAKVIDALEANAGANLFVSAVTHKNRRVIWAQGPLGGVYQTLDVKVDDAKHNPFYRPIAADGSQVQFDAGEFFALGRNGMWQTFIADAKGKRLDVVDPVIAHDYLAESDGAADVQVYAGRNCLVCHGAESGLNSFSDDQSRLLRTSKGRIELRSYSPEYVRRVVSFYDDDRLQRQLRFDRETHDMAVKRACGCSPAKATAALEATVKRLEYDVVSQQQAAIELGVPEEKIVAVIDGTHDPNCIALAEEHGITRAAFESCWPELAVKAENWRASK